MLQQQPVVTRFQKNYQQKMFHVEHKLKLSRPKLLALLTVTQTHLAQPRLEQSTEAIKCL